MNVWRSAVAEALGTALLLAAVVGSGIMGERLAAGNVAIALLANSLATGFALIALIVAFGSRSGAHFNPVVSAALALRGDLPKGRVAPYVVAQAVGAILGVLAAHAMFDLPLLQVGAKMRTGFAQWWSEAIATFGLVFLVLSWGVFVPLAHSLSFAPGQGWVDVLPQFGLGATGGWGLWLANQLCDLVQLRELPEGSVVRLHQHL